MQIFTLRFRRIFTRLKKLIFITRLNNVALQSRADRRLRMAEHFYLIPTPPISHPPVPISSPYSLPPVLFLSSVPSDLLLTGEWLETSKFVERNVLKTFIGLDPPVPVFGAYEVLYSAAFARKLPLAALSSQTWAGVQPIAAAAQVRAHEL